MKKLILLFSFIIITSCSSSSDDDNTSQSGSSKDSFNPPSWIIGTWKNGAAIYTFTKDDIVVSGTGTVISFKNQLIQFQELKLPDVGVKEIISNNSYIAEYKISSSNSIVFSFTKVSDTKITSNGYLAGDYTKQ